MRIIIIGISNSCEYLINYLEKRNHDIVVIDKKIEKVEAITNQYSVTAICGSGASREVLLKAKVEYSDYVITLTSIDEINILAASMAKNLGAKYVIASLERRDLVNDIDFIKNQFGIDCIINQNYLISNSIVSQACYNVAKKVSFFWDGKLILAELTINNDSIFLHKKLKDIKPLLDIDFLIIGVVRNNELLVPKGDFILDEKDTIGILSTNDKMTLLFSKLNLFHNPIKSIVLVGGGSLGEAILKRLIDSKLKISVLDSNFERCKYLLDKYPVINIINGNANDINSYKDLNISNNTTVVSTTGKDEINLLASIIAKSYNASEIISVVESRSYEEVLKGNALTVAISAPRVVAQNILENIYNNTNNINESHYYVFDNLFLKTFVFSISKDFKYISKKLMDIKFKKNLLVGAIKRKGYIFIPSGRDFLLKDDIIFVLSNSNENINSIDDICN